MSARKSTRSEPKASEVKGLDVVGIGSMVVDRLHRVKRILGADEKGILRSSAPGGHEVRVGGVVLNHLGWAAVLGLPTGIFGKQADDEGGRFLRGAMDRLGIARDRMVVVSKGEESPVCTEENEGCWARNRRGHFVITAK